MPEQHPSFYAIFFVFFVLIALLKLAHVTCCASIEKRNSWQVKISPKQTICQAAVIGDKELKNTKQHFENGCQLELELGLKSLTGKKAELLYMSDWQATKVWVI